MPRRRASNTAFTFSGYRMDIRGGGAREVYIATIAQRLGAEIMLRASGALEAGEDGERLFNSLVTVSVEYRFPPRRDADDENE